MVDELEKLDGAVERYDAKYTDAGNDSIIRPLMKWNAPGGLQSHA